MDEFGGCADELEFDLAAARRTVFLMRKQRRGDADREDSPQRPMARLTGADEDGQVVMLRVLIDPALRESLRLNRRERSGRLAFLVPAAGAAGEGGGCTRARSRRSQKR